VGTLDSPACRRYSGVVMSASPSLRADAANRVDIGEEAAGQRVDNFLLRALKGVPKSHVYRILRSGEVRLNGARVAPEARLAAGDRLRIPPIRLAVREGPPRARPLDAAILYEDDALVAVDKPAGLAVHGGSGVAHGLIEQLRAARPDARFLELVHRLDRDTSGVLLVAKKRAALTALHAAWRDGGVDKRYDVLVRGRWRDATRKVALDVHKFVTREGERRVRVAQGGQPALTIFRRKRTWPAHVPPLALLEAELRTGRTHQIRVHLTHLGFPLAGDDKYGDFAWNRELAKAGLKRMFLHAATLALAHPLTGEPLALRAPLPDDLARFVASLGADAQGRAAAGERA
jgi:23S rRNA pseudouridine955/2504/2580 synthase